MALKEDFDVSKIDISDLPDDPDKLAEHLNLVEPETETPAKADEKPAEAKAEEGAKVDDPDPSKAGKPDEGPGDVRKALSEARAKMRQETARAEERQAEVDRLLAEKAELEAKVKAAGVKPADEPAEITLPDDSEVSKIIEAIEEDAPQLAAAFKNQATANKAQREHIAALEASVGKLTEQLGSVVKRSESDEEEAKRVTAAEVDKAIQGNAKLAYIHDLAETSPEIGALWKQAGEIDTLLKGQAKWQGKPFSERFAQVVKILEVDNGEIKLPPEYLTKEQLEAQAKQASEEAKGGQRRPSTLSDLPGGMPPAQDTLGSIESADPVALLNSLTQSGDIDKNLETLLGKLG